MDIKQPTRISSLSEFIEWVKQLELDYNNHPFRGNYLFRGVPNDIYEINASTYHRLGSENKGFNKFRRLIEELIKDTRQRGHGERNGRELYDLEILAQLQHSGAATCLIDFTYNALTALWFACQQDSGKVTDGKVVMVQTLQLSKFSVLKPPALAGDTEPPYSIRPRVYIEKRFDIRSKMLYKYSIKLADSSSVVARLRVCLPT